MGGYDALLALEQDARRHELVVQALLAEGEAAKDERRDAERLAKQQQHMNKRR